MAHSKTNSERDGEYRSENVVRVPRWPHTPLNTDDFCPLPVSSHTDPRAWRALLEVDLGS
jgi:hypothetical protein